jgi:hypothetical protein
MLLIIFFKALYEFQSLSQKKFVAATENIYRGLLKQFKFILLYKKAFLEAHKPKADTNSFAGFPSKNTLGV